LPFSTLVSDVLPEEVVVAVCCLTPMRVPAAVDVVQFELDVVSLSHDEGIAIPTGLLAEGHASLCAYMTFLCIYFYAHASLLSGIVQGQVGWSSEHRGLVADVHAHGRGVGTR